MPQKCSVVATVRIPLAPSGLLNLVDIRGWKGIMNLMVSKSDEQVAQDAQLEAPSPFPIKHFLAVGVVILLAGILIGWQWPRLVELFSDETRVRLLIARLGWFGPLALILGNTLQIVVAPIPGYFVQAAAGYLYGPFWGGVWATCGLLTGSMLAMGLTRRFGRPLAVALVGQEQLDHWETATHSTSPFVWFLLLIAPIGDLPYFLAGLARVSYQRIALLTFVLRAPTVFAWAAIGAGVVGLSLWQWIVLFTVLGGLLVLFLRYQKWLFGWIEQNIQQRITEEDDSQVRRTNWR